jgi:tetratricopeptide (TPR) repeat protein
MAKTVDNRTTRVFLIALVIGALLCAWFGVRWQIGTLLAERTSEVDENATEIAGIAQRFAPLYSGSHRLLGQVSLDPEESISAHSEAVRNSPYDPYRRVDLARALEQNGDVSNAEIEYRRAVELAPNYSAPRWHLANYLMRRQRENEALQELRLAANGSRRFRDQAFSLVWDLYQKDPARVEFIAGDSPDAVAHLSYFLAARGSAEASLRNWDRLSPDNKKKNEKLAVGIANGLYIQRKYHEALGFFKRLGVTNSEVGQITDGSFEEPIGRVEDARFVWEIYRNEAKAEYATDSRVRRSGERSLRATFRGYSKATLYNVAQTVAVEPNTNYTLVFHVRGENLSSTGPPFIDVSDLINERSLTSSEPFASGSYDWHEFRLDLSTPPDCTGISVRMLRKFCGEECPLSGTLWLDDFELIRG